MGADIITCNGIVSAVLYILSLLVTRFILNHIKNKKEEINMKQVKFTSRIKKVTTSVLQTIWAVGTSIAGVGAS